MNKKNLLIAACFLTAITIGTSSAFAKGYGMAGCGLGSLIIKENGFVQIFAATSNGTYGNQTFGITSGTSNCTKDGIVKTDKIQEIFVHTNYESLEKEAALGKGEKLDALASLMGCQGKEFSSKVKKDYGKFFSAKESSPAFLLSSLKSEIASDVALRSVCKI